mmetsp:Transcript_97059/g.243353  ORF Transcript_97059/g.243353 Transcript_97059/m.243353 type:complete len:279 (+) Transcript_97059:710-1546(+)
MALQLEEALIGRVEEHRVSYVLGLCEPLLGDAPPLGEALVHGVLLQPADRERRTEACAPQQRLTCLQGEEPRRQDGQLPAPKREGSGAARQRVLHMACELGTKAAATSWYQDAIGTFVDSNGCRQRAWIATDTRRSRGCTRFHCLRSVLCLHRGRRCVPELVQQVQCRPGRRVVQAAGLQGAVAVLFRELQGQSLLQSCACQHEPPCADLVAAAAATDLHAVAVAQRFQRNRPDVVPVAAGGAHADRSLDGARQRSDGEPSLLCNAAETLQCRPGWRQ